jgi:hypothetical protein
MKDIVNALMRSIDIIESKMDFTNRENNDQDILELRELLGKAITSVYVRQRLEKRMRDFDFAKNGKLVDAIYGDMC